MELDELAAAEYAWLLAYFMKRAGMTVARLAEASGVAPQTIEHHLAGTYLPLRDTVDRLAMGLELSDKDWDRLLAAAERLPYDVRNVIKADPDLHYILRHADDPNLPSDFKLRLDGMLGDVAAVIRRELSRSRHRDEGQQSGRY